MRAGPGLFLPSRVPSTGHRGLSPAPRDQSGWGPRTWEGEKGRVLTGVLFGVRLLQESRKDRLALFSVTGDRATRLFFCRLSTEGGVLMPEPPTSVLGEMGISSPRLLRLRSEMVWPSRRYSVTLGTAAAGWRVGGACCCCCCCCDGWGCTGLPPTLPSADGSSGRSNLLRSHQASGSCPERGFRNNCNGSAFLPVDIPQGSFVKGKYTGIKHDPTGTSLAVQWLRLHASTAWGTGSFPGQGTKIPQAAWPSQKKKKKSMIPQPRNGHP